MKTSKKYLIREKDIICIDPFKKKSIIDLDKIKAIYIVVYTYADTLGTGRYMVIRDTTDKHKKIYDVILLRAGNLSSRIISDDSCFT
ncbi:MAG: hypothetical protein J5781_00625, partial [Clostridia bacterium]|nr:hypothetical protein [Clostridia bacterium]